MNLPYWLVPPALAAGFLLAACDAQAAEITVVVQYMQRSVVIERCSDQGIADEIERRLRASTGCVRFLPAVDNQNDVWCLVYAPILEERPWDEEALVEALRPLCFETDLAGQGR